MANSNLERLVGFQARQLNWQAKVLGLEGKWDSEGSQILLACTAELESNLKHRRQLGSGIARSFYQVEPNTANDNLQNYAKYRDKFMHLDSLLRYDEDMGSALEFEKDYALFHARLWYWRRPFKVLSRSDFESDEKYVEWIAEMYKKHFNTNLGAATPERCLRVCMRVFKEVTKG